MLSKIIVFAVSAGFVIGCIITLLLGIFSPYMDTQQMWTFIWVVLIVLAIIATYILYRIL